MLDWPRTVLWHDGEGRPRAPVRLVVATIAFLALAEGVRWTAAWLASAGESLGPALQATWVVLLAAGGFAVAIGAVVGVAAVLDRRYIADLGVGLDRTWRRETLHGAAVGVAMAVGVVTVALATDLATVRGPGRSWVGTLGLTAEHPAFDVALWGLVFLGAGILEEVLIRGYLLVNVAEGLAGEAVDASRAVLAGVIVSAVVFGLLHVANPGGTLLSLTNVVLFGIVLGASVAATGRLALAVGVHVAWNATLGLGFGLPVSGIDTGVALVDVDLRGPQTLTGGAFGPEGGALAVVGLGIGVAWLGWILRRSGSLSVDESLVEPDLWGGTDPDR